MTKNTWQSQLAAVGVGVFVFAYAAIAPILDVNTAECLSNLTQAVGVTLGAYSSATIGTGTIITNWEAPLKEESRVNFDALYAQCNLEYETV